jgi:chitin disaccharide deacetylase
MTRTTAVTVCLLLVFSCALRAQTASARNDQQAQLVIRCDDIGMCHSVNMAVKEVLESGIPVSTSIMFACPWWQEGVEILKQYPAAAHGIHLTLNSEWKNYRWGPAAGWQSVPTLTDSAGFFFPSRKAFFDNKPSLAEVERELRAQIERAMHSGIAIDYVDYHMGTAVETPEMRAIVEKLAAEYHLGVSRYFGEDDLDGAYSAPLGSKLDTLRAHLKTILPGTTRLMVFHIGLDTQEMDALVDQNSFGLKDVGKNRQGELRGLLAPEFMQTVKQMNIRLITYRELIHQVGLGNAKRP